MVRITVNGRSILAEVDDAVNFALYWERRHGIFTLLAGVAAIFGRSLAPAIRLSRAFIAVGQGGTMRKIYLEEGDLVELNLENDK